MFLWGALLGCAFTAGACDDEASTPLSESTPAPSTTSSDAGSDVQTPTPNQAVDAGAPTTSPDSGGSVASDAGAALDAAPDVSSPDAAPDAEPDGASALPSICTYADGSPIPYDHTIGIMEEFSLDEYQSCDLGGYITPLVNADPNNLTEVAAFNSALADWYRVRVLGCADTTTTAPDGTLLLLPLGAANEVSRGDVKSVVDLYMSVLKGHDGMPDGYDDAKKNEVKKRLQDLGAAAVKKQSDTLSEPSTDPGCIPSSDPDAGAPAADGG
ncbi:MAG TPA: hypothetical protein VGI39_31200 [Polyangiaceae bacterium]